MFRTYIFFIISMILVTVTMTTTTVVSTIVVPYNIDYVRSSLAASMYASLFSKISGEAKKSIMGGILAELFVEGLGRASFLPEKLKKGKMFFYKFLIPPIALCWWMKEGYSFTKELFTPQQSLEFDGNQIKNPIQYLFYFDKMISKLDVEKKEKVDNEKTVVFSMWKFYSEEEESEDKEGKISIKSVLKSISAVDKTLYNILFKVSATKGSINDFLASFASFIQTTSIIDSFQKEKKIISNSDKEEIDRNIQEAGKFIKLVTIELLNKESSLNVDDCKPNLDDCKNGSVSNGFYLMIDYLIAKWRRNFFLDIYYRQQNFNHGKNFYEKWKFASENIRSSLLYKMLQMTSNI